MVQGPHPCSLPHQRVHPLLLVRVPHSAQADKTRDVTPLRIPAEKEYTWMGRGEMRILRYATALDTIIPCALR